ncbi:hypothetical protein Tco_0403337 [Tanacetum coccineum]
MSKARLCDNKADGLLFSMGYGHFGPRHRLSSNNLMLVVWMLISEDEFTTTRALVVIDGFLSIGKLAVRNDITGMKIWL